MEDKYLQEDFVQKMSAQSLNSTGYYKPHRQKNTKLELLCARIIGYIPTCFGYYRCAIGSVLDFSVGMWGKQLRSNQEHSLVSLSGVTVTEIWS